MGTQASRCSSVQACCVTFGHSHLLHPNKPVCTELGGVAQLWLCLCGSDGAVQFWCLFWNQLPLIEPGNQTNLSSFNLLWQMRLATFRFKLNSSCPGFGRANHKHPLHIRAGLHSDWQRNVSGPDLGSQVTGFVALIDGYVQDFVHAFTISRLKPFRNTFQCPAKLQSLWLPVWFVPLPLEIEQEFKNLHFFNYELSLAMYANAMQGISVMLVGKRARTNL